MNKNQANKKAWEQAYAFKNDYDKTLYKHLNNKPEIILDPPLLETLKEEDLKDKTVMHFCTNNGRELMAVCRLFACKGMGFDIAENMVESANKMAEKCAIDAHFVATDILDIPKQYSHKADFVLVTIGALCWFENVASFFEQASKVLKTNGRVIVFESHPMTNIFAAKNEAAYNDVTPNIVAYDYFERKQWVETNGMGYMSNLETSHPFYAYSHTFSDIMNAMFDNQLHGYCLHEYPIDYGNVLTHLNNQGIPLSFIFKAIKTI